MKINKPPFQHPSSNSTFKVSTSSLLRCLKKILNNAIETPPPSLSEKT